MRAAIYARVSTTAQDPELQRRELLEYVARRRWALVREYIDRGVSGARDKRPELDALMDDVRRGRVDAVVVWKFDRFARSVRHLVEALEEFRALRVEFISLTEAIDTSTPLGRAVFAIVGAIAELERELVRERVRAGVATARARGKRIGRPRSLIDVEAARARISEGESARSVARSLGVHHRTLARALAR